MSRTAIGGDDENDYLRATYDDYDRDGRGPDDGTIAPPGGLRTTPTTTWRGRNLMPESFWSNRDVLLDTVDERTTGTDAAIDIAVADGARHRQGHPSGTSGGARR